MNNLIKFLCVISLTLILSCKSGSIETTAEKKRIFDSENHDLCKEFNSAGLKNTEEIIVFFKDKNLKQIPCFESSYDFKVNSKREVIECLCFVNKKDEVISFISIQLSDEPSATNYTFYKEEGQKRNLDNQMRHDFIVFKDYSGVLNSFCYDGFWYNYGMTFPN